MTSRVSGAQERGVNQHKNFIVRNFRFIRQIGGSFPLSNRNGYANG